MLADKKGPQYQVYLYFHIYHPSLIIGFLGLACPALGGTLTVFVGDRLVGLQQPAASPSGSASRLVS